VNFLFVRGAGLTVQETEAFCLHLGSQATAHVGGLEHVSGGWAQTTSEGKRGGCLAHVGVHLPLPCHFLFCFWFWGGWWYVEDYVCSPWVAVFVPMSIYGGRKNREGKLDFLMGPKLILFLFPLFFLISIDELQVLNYIRFNIWLHAWDHYLKQVIIQESFLCPLPGNPTPATIIHLHSEVITLTSSTTDYTQGNFSEHVFIVTYINAKRATFQLRLCFKNQKAGVWSSFLLTLSKSLTWRASMTSSLKLI
jgi:hypothetical protein